MSDYNNMNTKRKMTNIIKNTRMNKNKLLIDLAKKSGFSVRNREIFSPYLEDYDINDLLESFMDDIVRECAKVARNDIGRDWETCNNISENILSNFNVKG